MKNDNMSFTVRLNMKKSAHRQAWERLRTSGSSYTETVVTALNASSKNTEVEEWKNMVRAVIRETLTEAVKQLPAFIQINRTSSEPTNASELSDEDFDIADEFMNGL